LTTIPEHAILNYILIYNIYIIYYKYININYIKTNNIYLYNIYKALESFFKDYSRDTSLDELYVYVLSLYPSLEDKERGIYDSLFSEIKAQKIPESTIEHLVKSLERKEKLQKLALSAFDAISSEKTFEELKEQFKGFDDEQSIIESNEIQFVTSSLEELYEKQIKTEGLRWRLDSLNQSLGSLRQGDTGFIFSRPETGKTTFLASETTQMAQQTIQPILWFNNEEQGEKVMLRCYQAALGLTLEQLLSNRKKYEKQFRDLTEDKIKIYDQANIYKSEVEDFCEKFNPSLLIFDQIDKIKGFKADREDLALGEIYKWARSLAKDYAPVLAVCQADGTAEGVKWLTMGHVSNAKTSKQAEADWILGIGRSNEPGYESVRFFNISKNKLIGDKDSLPEMRHGRWEVLIEPTIARYKDII